MVSRMFKYFSHELTVQIVDPHTSAQYMCAQIFVTCLPVASSRFQLFDTPVIVSYVFSYVAHCYQWSVHVLSYLRISAAVNSCVFDAHLLAKSLGMFRCSSYYEH